MLGKSGGRRPALSFPYRKIESRLVRLRSSSGIAPLSRLSPRFRIFRFARSSGSAGILPCRLLRTRFRSVTHPSPFTPTPSQRSMGFTLGQLFLLRQLLPSVAAYNAVSAEQSVAQDSFPMADAWSVGRAGAVVGSIGVLGGGERGIDLGPVVYHQLWVTGAGVEHLLQGIMLRPGDGELPSVLDRDPVHRVLAPAPPGLPVATPPVPARLWNGPAQTIYIIRAPTHYVATCGRTVRIQLRNAKE